MTQISKESSKEPPQKDSTTTQDRDVEDLFENVDIEERLGQLMKETEKTKAQEISIQDEICLGKKEMIGFVYLLQQKLLKLQSKSVKDPLTLPLPFNPASMSDNLKMEIAKNK